MHDQEDLSPPADRADREPRPPLSRRTVLRGAAGAGVAGIAVTALAGTAAPALAAATRPAAPAARGPRPRPGDADATDLDATDQIVVHVRDARSGEIDVFRGTSQTRMHDRELAARLVRASR